jgi:hypothetical protein
VWETTVRVEQSAAVATSPELAWSLVSSPRAWSARPGGGLSFALDESGEGRCRFLLADAGGYVAAAVLEVAVLAPGQAISLQVPGRRTSWDLGVQPGKRGPVITLAAGRTVERPMKIDTDNALRDELRGWLAALAAIAEGRVPWPGEVISEPLRQACVTSQPVPKAFEATAAVLVDAPAEAVGQVIGTPELLRAAAPETIAYCGRIPGTPAGRVGDMTYQVQRVAGGQLPAIVSLRAAASPGTAMMRHVTPPFAEITYRWGADVSGTRLEVTHAMPGSPARAGQAERDQHAAAVEALARRYKAAIEAMPAA